MLDKVSNPRARGDAKPKPVTVELKLRKAAAHRWLEEAAEAVKEAAVRKRRDDEKKGGPRLSPQELAKVADELEEVQRELNPLLTRKDELSKRILAHWGHTGVEEIESGLGNTRITASLSLVVDPEAVEEKLGAAQWKAVTRRVLQVPLLLAAAIRKQDLRPAISAAVKAVNVKVAVVPPSSRTAKKGDAQDEGD